MALGALALFGATWRLWTPHAVFPRIPLVRAAGSVPEAIEWFLAVLMLVALFVVLVAPSASRWWRRSLVLFSAVLIALVLCDQQRLQTWVWQFAVMAPVLACVPGRHAIVLLRLFVVSIYLHSAHSKLNMTFLKSTGPTLVAGLLKALQLPDHVADPLFRRGFETLMPVGEFGTALALLAGRTRRWGLVFSITLHAFLLLALGPWGLNHRPGVLIWNGYFILQNLVLFSPFDMVELSSAPVETPEAIVSVSFTYRAAGIGATLFVAAAMLLPFLEPFGRFDHWPSWAVYSGATERVRVYVSSPARSRLPESLQPLVQNPAFKDGFCRVLIDRWPIVRLSAPIYPEDRFQLGVALWIARFLGSENDVMVILDSRADRWTDARTSRRLNGAAAIEQELEKFWWNGRPRGN